jgi:hypothetical protein
MCPRRSRIAFTTALCALALPAASARAADPVIVSQRILTGPTVLNGNMVYRQGPKPGVCMRRVGGKLSRATRLPLPDCGAGGMNLDSHGRVVSVYSHARFKGGNLVSVRWYAYDVKSDRTRRVTGLPGGDCIVSALSIWRTRTVYAAKCSSKKRSGVWMKEGKRTTRVLASAELVEGFVLRGGTLAGIVDVDADTFQAYQLMVGGKPCVRAIESSRDDPENKEVGGLWIANGNIVWARGYYPNDVPAPYAGLFTAKVPSHCAAPGPNGRFDFTPETVKLRSLALDGRQVYYAGGGSIRRHTLPAQPSYDPPANDNFENAQSLTVGTSSLPGRTAWATTQPGEPLADVKQTVWYTFTPATSATLSVHVDPLYRPGNELKFGVYTGTSLATLTPVGGPSSAPGSIQFDAVAGKQYWIDVGTSDAQANYMPLYVSVTSP